jgi:hypothetical protein
VATPAVGLGADVAAAEHVKVAWELNKFLNNFVFVKAAKEAEIVEFI